MASRGMLVLRVLGFTNHTVVEELLVEIKYSALLYLCLKALQRSFVFSERSLASASTR